MHKNCFSADDVIQLNLQNAKKIKLFISHIIYSRWVVFSNIALKKILNRSRLFVYLFVLIIAQGSDSSLT